MFVIGTVVNSYISMSAYLLVAKDLLYVAQSRVDFKTNYKVDVCCFAGLYLVTKFLFCANVVGQFFLLDAFLGGFYSYWGIEAMYTLAAEHEMKESRRFPRVTMCDFLVRDLKGTEVRHLRT